MLKKTFKFALTALALAITTFNANAASNQCMPIGGTALAEAIDETSFVAELSGAFASANAKVTNQTKTDTGLVLDIEHTFLSDKGGLLKTRDKAVLTAVPGKNQTYMIEIAYNVVDARGAYTGYKGTFNSFGLIKLSEGKIVIRYSGELCK